MEVAMPIAGSAMDSYEDMFKEITRKLYGEEGLPDLTADRIASGGQDRLVSLDYDVESPLLKPEEHLTAFGLAALMQNGFPPSGILNTTFTTLKPQPTLSVNSVAATSTAEDKWVTSEEVLQWTQSKIATYNPSQKLFRCSECDCVGYLLRVAEHWLGTHSNIRAFHCPQCTYESAWARCVRIHLSRQHNIDVDESCEELTKDNPVLQEVIKYLQRLKTKVDGTCVNKMEEFQNIPATTTSSMQNCLDQGTSSVQASQSTNVASAKRYSCTFCPYATDRRDLFTRHENIHREEKPFQCYVCQKQFNRADHVKKHFLRMHRDHPYDLNRIRRHPPKNASGMSYYQKYNAAVAGSTTTNLQQETLTTLSTIGSLNIPGFNNMPRPSTTISGIRPPEVKNGKPIGAVAKSGSKKKGEKRFTCCYCSWSGVDNWCLKRHMNTHLKPFVCVLCDYKAARSERLATHVLKVHNKRTCSKCNFLAEDLMQLTSHQQDQHPNEHRSRTLSTTVSTSSQSQTSTSNILRNNMFANSTAPSAAISSNTAIPTSVVPPIIPSTTTGTSQLIALCSEPSTSIKTTDLSVAAAQILQHNRFLQADVKTWKSQLPKPHGAARLFNYMEASDGSDQEDSDPSSRNTDGDLVTRVTLAQRIQSDFLEAGGVDNNQQEADEEVPGEETELPLFVCSTCGCEFEDDLSLETHQLTHRHVATSPASKDSEETKENVDPGAKYSCKLCEAHFDTQNNIVAHLVVHTSLATKPVVLPTPSNKSKRKQHKPQKVVIPYWDPDEVEVLRHLSSKLRKWRDFLLSENSGGLSKLVDKYMAKLVTRRGLICRICKSSGIVRYHTKASLSLHYSQKHAKVRYSCEHCNMTFRHKYQTILHSSRVHTEPPKPYAATNTSSTVTMPASVMKDIAHISLENVPSADLTSFTNFFTTSHNVAVPDSNITNAHKLGMSFFDHNFIHNNAINTHMPIIIPTFQPN